MGKVLKTVDHKGVKYEIQLIQRADGSSFIKAFKDGNPFNPYYYSTGKNIDVIKVEVWLGTPISDYLISEAEDGIKFWVDNKDTLEKFLHKE